MRRTSSPIRCPPRWPTAGATARPRRWSISSPLTSRPDRGLIVMAARMIGTRAEWSAARGALLEREKELTRLGDEVARQRRELPWVPVEADYTFATADGPRSLRELFGGRAQLVVYPFTVRAGDTGR